jgi:hypothetical protein
MDPLQDDPGRMKKKRLTIGYNLDVMKPAFIITLLFTFLIISGCGGNAPTAIPTAVPSPITAFASLTPSPTSSPRPSVTTVTPTQDVTQVLPTSTSTISPTIVASATPTFDPSTWTELPVIPIPDKRILEIYQRGVELGNNPHTFSKVGDCGSTPTWFLGDFDRSAKSYNLGDYQYLQAVIQEFQGSYSRTSLAARSGFNASSVFAPIWADPSQCKPNESPLACEYRINKPAFAFIMLGTNDVWHKADFEPQMRKIIEFSVENGVIPILSTKADNEEGDGSINATTARLAMEYGVPLWNYWLAVQPLPAHGLQEDHAHITWGPNRFNDPLVMKKGWPVRNLTALQTLDTVWRFVSQPR